MSNGEGRINPATGSPLPGTGLVNVPQVGGELSDTTVQNCRNLACLYVGNPDPREYPGADQRCPRCGTPWNKRPLWRGPPPSDLEEGQGLVLDW